MDEKSYGWWQTLLESNPVPSSSSGTNATVWQCLTKEKKADFRALTPDPTALLR